jgi:hypothetical protein
MAADSSDLARRSLDIHRIGRLDIPTIGRMVRGSPYLVSHVRYALTFKGRGPARLEAGATRQSVAEECRATALELIAGAAAGWQKLDLVLWLTGPYQHATRHVPRGERVAHVEEDDELEPEAIDELVVRVRGEVLASLARAALEYGAIDFADDAVTRGIVRKAQAETGESAWVPVDIARMRLRDRLRSLFAADYLNAPATYTELFVCQRCEAVVFDAGAKRLGVCAAHKRVSGVVPRDDGSTPKVAGDD